MILITDIQLPFDSGQAPKSRFKCGDIICLTLSVRANPGEHTIKCELQNNLNCTFENEKKEISQTYNQTELSQEGIQICFSIRCATTYSGMVILTLWGDSDKSNAMTETIKLTCD